MEQSLYDAYLEILKEELVPAMGCTEPIAVAYAAALAAAGAGLPGRKSAEVAASANIIKNVKSVVVPHTGGPPGHCRCCRRRASWRAMRTRSWQVLCGVTEEDLTTDGRFPGQHPHRGGALPASPTCLTFRCGCSAADTPPTPRSRATTPTSSPCSGTARCWWKKSIWSRPAPTPPTTAC